MKSVTYINSNKPVGTIVSFAKKEVADFTAAILPFIRDYKDYKALEFTPSYPYNYDSTEPIPEDEKVLKSTSIEEDKETTDFWNEIKSGEQQILNFSDSDIKETQSKNKLKSTTKHYIIPLFDNDNLKRTRFRGACGPTALAWVYRGFFNKYNNEYIPIHGDMSTTNYEITPDIQFGVSFYEKNTTPLYNDLAKHCRIGEGLFKDASTLGDMKTAVEKCFGNYTLKAHTGTIKGAPRRAIERGNPVLLMVVSPKGKGLHYLVGFGTKNRYTKILFVNFHSNSWILVTDNGFRTSSHNYLPYYRNSHFLNFGNKYLAMREFVKTSELGSGRGRGDSGGRTSNSGRPGYNTTNPPRGSGTNIGTVGGRGSSSDGSRPSYGGNRRGSNGRN